MDYSLVATLNSYTPSELKSFFAFNKEDPNQRVLFKFSTWMNRFFPQYFSSKDAPFHEVIDLNNLKAYRGEIDQYVDAAFKGAAKTSRTKLFVAFTILNDQDHFRRYIRVLSADGANSAQISTDVYNMLVNPAITFLWPETFTKNSAKREERMSSFTTSTGVKLFAGTVGTSQRGALQEDARPDFVWFEDFENRTTLRSARKTKVIWENMEEARTGLAKGGSCLYTCNYLSEMGNVHKLVQTIDRREVTIIPIIRSGVCAWPARYTLIDIDQMKATDEDFEGERLCQPSAAKDIVFDRETLDLMPFAEPIRTVAGFKIFKEFDASHMYGGGHDVAGGVGLDSSTSVYLDFSTVPARVVGTFKSNTIKPDTFADEIKREGEYFNNPIEGIEKNNHGHATIARARQLELRLYKTQKKSDKIDKSDLIEYGWHTNTLTKSQMVFGAVKAVNDGLVQLSDPDLIAEVKSYTRNDLIDSQPDPRLVTNHFDLFIAFCIAWQMKDFAFVSRKDVQKNPEPEENLYDDIGL